MPYLGKSALQTTSALIYSGKERDLNWFRGRRIAHQIHSICMHEAPKQQQIS